MPITKRGARPDPKAPLAIELWKRYAGQIEADLHGRADIADWHQDTRDEHGRPKLNSRRLLVLLKYSDDDSAFARDYVRGGRMVRWQRAIEEIFNEQLRMRASYEAVASRGEVRWDPNEFAMLDPIDAEEAAKRQAAEEAEEEQASEDFYTDLGFS